MQGIVHNLIKQAIDERKQVIAKYRGQTREMCPDKMGPKYGSGYHVLAYQFAGYSSRGLKPIGSTANWRCFDLDNLTEVTLIEGEWHSYTKGTGIQTCVDDIEFQVSRE